MLASLALGVLRQGIYVALLLGRETIWIQRRMRVVRVLHEFQSDFGRRDVDGILAAIVHGEQHREHRLSAAPCFFQFLGVHPKDNSKIRSPESVTIFAIVVPAKGATGLTFLPA